MDIQRHAPAALLPGKRPGTIVQEAGWALGPVWMVRKFSPSLGFDFRTVQPVANRYTEYAFLARTTDSKADNI